MLRVLREALEVDRRLGDERGQAHTLTVLGELLVFAGDYPAATRSLEQALGLFRAIGNRKGESTALTERGTLHRVNGEFALAERCHQQALDLARTIDAPWNEASALAGLGRCTLAAGRPAEAADQLRQALEIFRRIGAAEAPKVAAELDALKYRSSRRGDQGTDAAYRHEWIAGVTPTEFPLSVHFSFRSR